MLYAVLYVRVNCFVVRECAVWRRYINVCNSDVLCVLMIIEGVSVVGNGMVSLMSVISPPLSCAFLCDLSVRTVVRLCPLGVS